MMIIMNTATSVVLVVSVLSVTGSVVLITAIRGVVESIRIRHGNETKT